MNSLKTAQKYQEILLGRYKFMYWIYERIYLTGEEREINYSSLLGGNFITFIPCC